MSIRRATAGDAAALSSFGRRVFHSTIAPENRPEDLAAYLDEAYTEDRQHAEIADPDIDTLLLEREGALAAFAQLRAGPAPDCLEGAQSLELWRFYVGVPWQGRGLAAELLAGAEATSRARHARFYRKHGFTVAGSQIFMMGSDPPQDLIMVKTI